MNRKKLYGLLAILLLVPIAYLAALPSSTRATFFYEFKHNVGTLLGYEPDPIVGADGSSGLRLEHPEEYGVPHADGDAGEEPIDEVVGDEAEAKSVAAESDESSGAGTQ